MKLQQFRYLLEVNRQQLNISKAAASLCTSQSGVSKQIQLLEQELNIHLFKRKGKHLTAFSEAGEKILQLAGEVMGKVNDIRLLADDINHRNQSLTIATTHTQARYVLPAIVSKFMRIYPEVNLHFHQGTPPQVAAMLEQGDADIAIATEALVGREQLLALPCYQWTRCIITRKNHALAHQQTVRLEEIVDYPIITYEQGFTGRYKLDEAFARAELYPDIVLTAVDADVIKTYVRLGLGIGIIAEMAFNPNQDNDLHVLNAGQLFGISISQIAIKKDKYIKDCIFRFIALFAPHLPADIITQGLACDTDEQVQNLLKDCAIPDCAELLKHSESLSAPDIYSQ